MDEQGNHNSTQKSEFSSPYTKKAVREARFILGDELKEDLLEEKFAELAGTGDELEESELAQLTELARILESDPEAEASLDVLNRDGTFQLESSSDRMSLLLDVMPPVARGKAVSVADVLQTLRDQGIERGIILDEIQQATELAAQGETVKGVVIVAGQLPTKGSNDRYQVFARRSPLDEPELVGTPADIEDLKTPLLCAEGDLVLRRIPGKPGEPGYTATGQVLPPEKIEPVLYEAGSNVRREKNDYYAELSGVILLGPQRIDIRRMLVLTEDVTRKNGIVEFDGEIIIRAGVRRGATIHATSDITIEGPVEAANITSKEGSITLKHGVAGQRTGVIRAAVDVDTRFAENVSIFAGRNITIHTGSLHSHLVAGNAIFLIHGRGQFIGGSAVAGEFIEARRIGSTTGVMTEVLVGLGKEAMIRIGEIDSRVSYLKHRRDQARELADKLERAVGDPSKLGTEEVKTYTSLRKYELIASHELKKLENTRRELLSGAEHHAGYVVAGDEIMPNVTVRIGQASLEVVDTIKRCKIILNGENGEIQIQSYR